MRILQVNKFYYLQGGAEKSVLEIEKELKVQGHDLAIFSMKHEKNLSSPWSRYFVSKINFNNPGLWDLFRIPGRIIYSFEARFKFRKVLNKFKPDLIIYHNIYHQLSPSILSLAKKRGIKTAMILHDYKLICPNFKLFTQGKNCNRCQDGKYYHCVLKRCLKKSFSQSLVALIEMHLHHHRWHIYEKNIDVYIAPSQFIKNKFLEFKYPTESIVVLKNFFPKFKTKIEKKENYLLSYGRLSKEKGIDIILLALINTKEKLKIVGVGPEEKQLRELVKKLKLKKQVEFLGQKNGMDLERIIRKAKAVIFASLWYENMPFAVLESMSLSKLIIASKIGGLPEVIQHEKNGLLFPAGDPRSLNLTLKNLNNYNLALLEEKAAKSAKRLNLSLYCQKLLAIFDNIG
jgi:glycosyltransferase involved in cell wall biosynthesis